MKNLYILILLVAALPCFAANVTIDTNVKYQTIMGYGSASWYPERISSEYRDEIIREYVFDMGINRLRLEIPGGNKSNTRRWEWLNDDDDPYHFNWENFNTKDFDKHIEEVIVPYRDYLQSIGKKLDLYVSPSYFEGGSTGGALAWLINSPAEYAEHALSLLIHLKEKYNIEADFYCILNEAGNNNAFTAKVVADMIRELGPRMREAGLKTMIQFPESISASVAWNYIQSTKNDPDIWQYIGLISYHLYGTNDPFRDSIRVFAEQKGIPTAQTEYMSLNINVFYDDLVKGGVSYWEIYGVSSCMDITYEKISKNSNYWNFRLIMHHVEPGSVRVKAESDDSTVKALAFLKDGKTTVVLINGKGDKTVNVKGLENGNYGTAMTWSGQNYESGITINNSKNIEVILNANVNFTLYPYSGNNLPPRPVYWLAEPEYKTVNNNPIKLKSLAIDPENNPIEYKWSVKSKPQGSNPVIDAPNALETNVNEINISGKYIFQLEISDGQDTISKEIRFDVFAGNTPPILLDVHNRIPVLITLPVDTTLLRSGTWDAENNKIKYKWEIVSQPTGADAQLMTPDTNNSKVKNMSVAGDYILKITANDGTNTVSEEITVPVYPINNAPVINSITATPPKIYLPMDSIYVEAEVSDVDNDNVTCWWTVKSAPSGTKPKFRKPGLKNTVVGNLSKEGNYIFTLNAIDGTKKTSKDITVTVLAPDNVNEFSDNHTINLYPNPFSGKLMISDNDENNFSEIIIYNSLGIQIRNIYLINGKAIWDGNDNFGCSLPAGLYFISMEISGKKLYKLIIKY
jgi:hypothetical protein